VIDTIEPLHLALAAASLAVLVAIIIAWRASHNRIRRQERELALQARITLLETDCENLQASSEQLRDKLELAQQDISHMQQQRASLEARHEEVQRAATEKLQLLQSAREQLTTQFDNLANRIFEEKSERFVATNRQSMESTLGPLRNQLQEFRKRVDDVYDKETRDRVSLREELATLKTLNLQMSEDAVNLTRALKGDKKTQGNWGELVLERVLEESGLRKGHEYETQVGMRSDAGKLQMPDVIIRLPDNKDVVVDAKVSLVDYEQYVNAEDESAKQEALQRHLLAVRNHISGLSIKEYSKLESLRTLDFVLMFIPVESAFIAAYDADPSMFLNAYDKQVIVVGPTNLLATLRTIQTIWRYDQQNRNAEKIASMAGGIFDQFAMVITALDEASKNLGRAQESMDTVYKRFATGRGNLVRRVEQLQKLGARTSKKLPESVKDEQDDNAIDSQYQPQLVNDTAKEQGPESELDSDSADQQTDSKNQMDD